LIDPPQTRGVPLKNAPTDPDNLTGYFETFGHFVSSPVNSTNEMESVLFGPPRPSIKTSAENTKSKLKLRNAVMFKDLFIIILLF